MEKKDTTHVYQLRQIPVSRPAFAKAFTAEAAQNVQGIADRINQVVDACKALIDKRFVKMKNKKVWYDHQVAGLYPNLDEYEMPAYDTARVVLDHLNSTNVKNYITTSKRGVFQSFNVEGFSFVLPTASEAITTFHVNNNNPYIEKKHLVFSETTCSSSQLYFFADDYNQTNTSYLRIHDVCGHFTTDRDLWVALIPIFRLKEKNARPMSYVETIAKWLDYDLVPEGLSKKVELAYRELGRERSHLLPYLDFQNGPNTVKVKAKKLTNDIMNGAFKETVFGINFDVQTALDAVLSGEKQYTGSLDGLKQSLLNCDYRRCALMPYPEKRLTDINLGHWELFEDAPEDSALLTLPNGEAWTARPPQMDVYEDGVCAIDFGTKSTVVACQRNEARLLRIGNGDFTKEATLQDYENPTCIELRNFSAFWEAYTSREGRPFTEWEQLTVSHQAASVLLKSDADSSDYYAVFSELKQWANAKGRRRLLKDRKHGTVIELKPYLELDENSFDPIEIYAYYLGLAINNMYNGIYLDYTLSFPVNYSKDVRDRLLTSFRRGLRKSLMPALLNDEECMQNFRVYAGASEPAAYAMAALKAYHLQPQDENDSTAYGVFDFGGGTTDFDFGIEHLSKNRRKYKYQLEEFGQGGDVYLGGENLLNDLAYEVYKKNRNIMRKEYITFALPPNCSRAAGMEGLVLEESEASQMAFMNRKRIAELLRPLWEHTEGYENNYTRPSSVILYASDKPDNESKVQVELEFSTDELEKVIKEHIDGGVDNFFHALAEAFQDREMEKKPIHIFLAGNSCRSHFVRESFDAHIEAFDEYKFVLHDPLGTAAEHGDEDPAVEFDQRMTAKTGVAFGLLRSRKGGKDVRIVNQNFDASGEATFRYFLGDIDEDEHFHVRIPRTVGYNIWQPFCYADETDFEIWYTSKPSAMDNQLKPEEVKKIKCRITDDETSDDDEVKVFIRRTKPDCLEYAVGREADFKDGETLKQKKIYQRELK